MSGLVSHSAVVLVRTSGCYCHVWLGFPLCCGTGPHIRLLLPCLAWFLTLLWYWSAHQVVTAWTDLVSNSAVVLVLTHKVVAAWSELSSQSAVVLVRAY